MVVFPFHNAFEGVARSMESLRGRSDEDRKNYLLKAAQNAAINLAKRERKQDDYYACLDHTASDDVLEMLCAKIDRETVVHQITQIKEPYQTVLYCHFVMEMDHKQIASVLNRKPDAVRQQLSRGRKILQTMLEEVLQVHV